MSARENFNNVLNEAGYAEDMEEFKIVIEDEREFIFVWENGLNETFVVSRFCKINKDYIFVPPPKNGDFEGSLEECLNWLVKNNYA